MMMSEALTRLIWQFSASAKDLTNLESCKSSSVASSSLFVLGFTALLYSSLYFYFNQLFRHLVAGLSRAHKPKSKIFAKRLRLIILCDVPWLHVRMSTEHQTL